MSDQQPEAARRYEVVLSNPDAGPFRDWVDYLQRGVTRGQCEFVLHKRPTHFLYYPTSTAPDYPRATLEEVEAAVDDLPDQGGCNEVFVVDHRHPKDPWLARTGGQPILSSYRDIGAPLMLGLPCGLTLFRPTRDTVADAMLEGWFQGWWDYGAYGYGEFRNVTNRLGLLLAEPTTFTDEELRRDWSWLGLSLFSRPGDAKYESTAFEACIADPLRSTLAAAAMEELLGNEKPTNRPIMRHYRDRVSLVAVTGATLALKRFAENSASLPDDADGNLLSLLKGYAAPSSIDVPRT